MVDTSKTKRVDSPRAQETKSRDTPTETRSTPTAPAGSNGGSGSFTYKPAPGDPEYTVAFGRTFKAGQAVQIDDERQAAKLRGHPQFGFKADEGDDKAAQEMDKAHDKTSEEARAAREKADEAVADAEAKERAQRALAAVQSAQNDPDRDPPITNHASQMPGGAGTR